MNNLREAAPTVVEPVASLMTHIKSGNVKLVWNDEAFDRTLWRETPLYAHPPRKPLTEEDIEKMIATRHFDPKYVKCSSDEVCLNWYRLGLRDGERAHGITEGGAT
ncbi:hypothetical protein UFOVP764_29 [uncultured Caudovirales phage]|uniref:Uncharacterized protein n=1 Tax=uncultured Caudovirales phage TaxID=2100421 RepID=A0A6J5NTQ5_9CAUD|nr:hypothetical protein UFOVP764_29 [uncultured Caudovirales phage]